MAAIITFKDLLGAHGAVTDLKNDDWNWTLDPSCHAKLIPSLSSDEFFFAIYSSLQGELYPSYMNTMILMDQSV